MLKSINYRENALWQTCRIVHRARWVGVNHAVEFPLRLRHYDYSRNGAYFVTICTYSKSHLFASKPNYISHENITPPPEKIRTEAPVPPYCFRHLCFMEGECPMEPVNRAWLLFCTTGKIDDYLQYKQLLENPPDYATGDNKPHEADVERHRPAGLQN